MLNTADPTIKRFMENLHNSIERRKRNLSSNVDDDYILENLVIKVFCEETMFDPYRCAEMINSRYDRNLSGDRIIQTMRFINLNYREKRLELFDWATKTMDAFVKALKTHEPEDFNEFLTLRKKELINGEGGRYRIQERVCCIMLFVKHPELSTGKDAETIERFGNAFMRSIFVEVVDFLRNICIGRRGNGSRGERNSKQEKIERLENMLNRSDMLLKDLQDEFDSRIKESHQDDMVEFFSQLNSEKYGCILDEVLSVRNGVRQLRKKNIQLPPEIGGLFILIERLAQFIRDNEINPILKPGVVQDMRLAEVESCDYEGSPFLNASEVKRVKVLSPGWVYRNKDVQIARPRLKEVGDE